MGVPSDTCDGYLATCALAFEHAELKGQRSDLALHRTHTAKDDATCLAGNPAVLVTFLCSFYLRSRFVTLANPTHSRSATTIEYIPAKRI